MGSLIFPQPFLPKYLFRRNPTDTELERLYQEGFRTIISLLDETQQHLNYDVQKTEAMGFKRYSIPVRDCKAPSQKQYQEFLEIIAHSKDKVIIHCQAGSGRTGMMGAAYWISKGLPAHREINKVRKANPGAVEEAEQEDSLYELSAVIVEEG